MQHSAIKMLCAVLSKASRQCVSMNAPHLGSFMQLGKAASQQSVSQSVPGSKMQEGMHANGAAFDTEKSTHNIAMSCLLSRGVSA